MLTIKIKGNYIEVSYKNIAPSFPLASLISELKLKINNDTIFNLDIKDHHFYLRVKNTIYPKERLEEVLDVILNKKESCGIIVPNKNGLTEGIHELMISNNSNEKTITTSFKIERSDELINI